MIDEIISELLESPTDENKEKYNSFVLNQQHELLKEVAYTIYKSQDYFNKKSKAHSYKRDCAIKLISKWVEKYGTTEGCPVKYADTLLVPFQQIKPLNSNDNTEATNV